VIETVFGMSFEKPARHMHEYLEILMPVLAGEQTTFAGETLSASTFGPLQIDAPAPDVLVAALGTVGFALTAAIPVAADSDRESGHTLVVAPSGSDANACTKHARCATIAHAVSVAIASARLNPSARRSVDFPAP